MVLLIGYDLQQPSQKYDELFAAIREYGAWWHNLDSTWIIETNDSPESVRNKLMEFLDDDDKLIVIEVKKHWAAKGFKESAYAWLKERSF